LALGPLFFTGCMFPEVVITKDPLTAVEHGRLAAVYESKGEYDLAEKEYTAALEREPANVAAAMELGNLYLKMGAYGKAERVYKKALKGAPDSGPLHNNLSWAYMGLGDLNGAERSVKRALDLDGSRRPIYLDTLGVIHTRRGEYDSAEARLMKALKGVGPDDRAGRTEIYTHLIELYTAWGKGKKAAAFAAQRGEGVEKENSGGRVRFVEESQQKSGREEGSEFRP